MLGGEEEVEDHRRNHHLADQPRPSLDPVEENNATSNVFGFITEWITSVSFVKGIFSTQKGERDKERESTECHIYYPPH